MELVLGNDDLTWKIFSRLTELRDIMRADEVSREWHALMQDDRVWEPLCRMHKGRGPLAAAGFGMLSTLKENTQLSWRQLFVQRARALQPLSDEDPAPRARRREGLYGYQGCLKLPRPKPVELRGIDMTSNEALFGKLQEKYGNPHVTQGAGHSTGVCTVYTAV